MQPIIPKYANKSVVFIVDTLAQHGAERYLLELVKVLVGSNHVVAVCAIDSLLGEHSYYAKELNSLGVDISIVSELPFPNIKNKIIKRIINSFAFRVLNKIDNTFISKKRNAIILGIMKKFDEVSIIKWDVYIKNPILFDALHHKKIHVLSALPQYIHNPYIELPKSDTEFVLMYEGQKDEIVAGREIPMHYNFSVIPLLIDNESWPNCYNPKNDSVFRIGIFSRINKDQPTLFALFVIHLLKAKGLSIKLYFFGRYYDEEFYAFYLKTIEMLRITENVEFMGHTTNIPAAIYDNNLDIGLMNSMNDSIGYSSIELQSLGLPVLFYNISNDVHDSGGMPIMCNDLQELSRLIEHYCVSRNELKCFSDLTFKYAKERYGIKDNRDSIISIYS
jgi:glycosyltransferase involved in cell wall biosynthesis